MVTKKTASSRTGKKARSSEDGSAEKSARSEGSTKRSSSRGSAKKSAPRKSGSSRSASSAPRAAAPKRTSASAIAAAAARQLLELTGREAEGVTGLERSEDGWKVHVEVVEVRRIPDTTDVLALYEVEVDTEGDMTGYHRLRRYARGVPGEE